ncbi:hypothetical protein BS47DRAFT_1375127 [Hydnum rufescens UP504]|uniref:NIF system FeS cluster assembly NifU N-terminal domain-containing protein n=1 Tax=Hydnum rufescens UP504 TaxID=1448309 RepID=A0A9P6B7Z4_9AGAM|nr:hypothetical protein BS47DRAFT_1375127 [Hydnum rufescens UP504]
MHSVLRPTLASSSRAVARSAAVVSPALSRPAGAFSNLTRSYHAKVIEHYERPQNVGSLPKGLVGAPACGDVMKLQIRVNEDGIISDVKFKTFGCGSAIASSSYMTQRVKGLTLEAAGAIKNTEIAKELSLPPVKLHCSMLAEDAIRSAIRDYRTKRQNLQSSNASDFIDVSQNVATSEAARLNETPPTLMIRLSSFPRLFFRSVVWH